MPCRVLVLRHGQSTWNAAGRWQGQADPPLSELGEAQAATAARSLGQFDIVVASDLERARVSAEIVAADLGIGPVELDERFRERDAGPWTGLTSEEIEERWPGWYWSDERPDGFEDDPSVAVRSLAALISLRRRTHAGAEILVVAHGGVIKALRALLGAPDVRISNLAGCWFTVRSDDVTVDHDLVDLLPDELRSPSPPDRHADQRL